MPILSVYVLESKTIVQSSDEQKKGRKPIEKVFHSIPVPWDYSYQHSFRNSNIKLISIKPYKWLQDIRLIVQIQAGLDLNIYRLKAFLVRSSLKGRKEQESYLPRSFAIW